MIPTLPQMFFSSWMFWLCAFAFLVVAYLWRFQRVRHDEFLKALARIAFVWLPFYMFPAAVNFAYPCHVMDQRSWYGYHAGWIPRGVLHHPSPTEITTMRRQADEWWPQETNWTF